MWHFKDKFLSLQQFNYSYKKFCMSFLFAWELSFLSSLLECVFVFLVDSWRSIWNVSCWWKRRRMNLFFMWKTLQMMWIYVWWEGFYISDHPVEVYTMKEHLASIWRLGKGVAIEEVLEGLFIFQFYHPIDMHGVIFGGPWSFDNCMHVLNRMELGHIMT